MFCKFCGKQLPDGSEFCSACGKNQKDPVASAKQVVPLKVRT